jgi:hypothetical protein
LAAYSPFKLQLPFDSQKPKEEKLERPTGRFAIIGMEQRSSCLQVDAEKDYEGEEEGEGGSTSSGGG